MFVNISLSRWLKKSGRFPFWIKFLNCFNCRSPGIYLVKEYIFDLFNFKEFYWRVLTHVTCPESRLLQGDVSHCVRFLIEAKVVEVSLRSTVEPVRFRFNKNIPFGARYLVLATHRKDASSSRLCRIAGPTAPSRIYLHVCPLALTVQLPLCISESANSLLISWVSLPWKGLKLTQHGMPWARCSLPANVSPTAPFVPLQNGVDACETQRDTRGPRVHYSPPFSRGEWKITPLCTGRKSLPLTSWLRSVMSKGPEVCAV